MAARNGCSIACRRAARDAFTYLHVVIVAGILLCAVGDELVIAHPTEELPNGELAVVACGPALYLLAHVALRLRMASGPIDEAAIDSIAAAIDEAAQKIGKA